MEVTPEMMAAQDKRIANSIADVSIGIDALRAENSKLRDALRRALLVLDSPHYRDNTGLRPSAHPAVDDIRAVLTESN